MSARDGLVVVVPKHLRGFDPSAVLRERQAWIEDAQAHFAQRRESLLAGPDAMLPSDIEFAATGERFRVEYRQTPSSTVRASERGETVLVQGDIEDGEACVRALQRWLHAAARERLLPLLAEESVRTGLTYTRASVRGQRSRWGGCSARGGITLNRGLLFLRAVLARSVILHELAHIRQPNHSAAFWRELEALDPKAREHQAAIKRSWDAVPTWAEP